MELSRHIKEHRVRLGMSQEQLAETIYVSRQTISNWETEQSQLPAGTKRRLRWYGIERPLDDKLGTSAPAPSECCEKPVKLPWIPMLELIEEIRKEDEGP